MKERHIRDREDDTEYRRRSIDRRDVRSREDRPRVDWRREQKKSYPLHPRVQKERFSNEVAPKVDRRQTCPFLVRIFYAINNENTFAGENLPQNQVKLHLWMNSSLREICQILRAYLPNIRTKQRFQFWRVASEEDGRLTKQELGSVTMHRRNDRAEECYIGNHRFAIGDYLDVSINYK